MTLTDIQTLELPDGPISEVILSIAHYANVSGLGSEPLYDSTQLRFLDGSGDTWTLYFGPGRDADGSWGGGPSLD